MGGGVQVTLSDLASIMFRASQCEVGLLLRVSDPERAKRAFARAREEHNEGSVGALPPVKFRILMGHPEGNLAVGPAGAKWKEPSE
jgi:hypothetical protein